MNSRKTAGLIVIGDEILKGSTIDTNSNFICKKLHDIGVNVKKISIIGDNVDDISSEIRSFSDQYDIVFTTGGVGPTHDDKTYIGLARAFKEELYLSNEIQAAIANFLPPENPPQDNIGPIDKLSMIPRSAQLLWGRRRLSGRPSLFPVVRLKNVISFPGVPKFCEKAFLELQDQLFPASEFKPLFSETIFTSDVELKFSDKLSKIAEKYENSVEVGSYPVLNNKFYKTKLVVESESSEAGRAVVVDIKNLLKENVIYYDDVPWVDTMKKMARFRHRELQKDINFVSRLDQAISIVDEIVEKYPLEEIAISFNGGKDCTVLLHLLRMKVDQKYGECVPIQGFHIMCEDQFPEASQFIIDIAKQYNIDVLEFPGPLKSGLDLLKKQRPNIISVFMGSRSSDPKGKYMVSPTQWTDSDWPRVLRVCPILSWSYSDVWRTLRGLCVPYCSLYDEGYTSLGGRDSTFKNEKLRVLGKDGKESYLPAFMLEDDKLERNGRSV